MTSNPLRFALLPLAAALSACGGGGGSGSGALTLGVTDAPIDDADRVVVNVSGIELQTRGGERLSFPYGDPTVPDSQQIDLLALQGGVRKLLLDGTQVPAGDYAWMRLQLVPGSQEGYVLDKTGGQHPLRIPSGAESGLKLNTPFSIAEGSSNDYTLDFDLRRSVSAATGGEYRLRPTLRLVRTEATATVSGQVAGTLLSGAQCGTAAAVYAFEGAGVTPDDIDGNAPDPVASAAVGQDATYTLAFLPAGTYTLAFTCQADADQPEQDDAIVFDKALEVSLAAGEDLSQDF